MNRGDIVLVRFPHPSGLRGKKRPAVIVQSNHYQGIVNSIIVAEITSNTTLSHLPACLYIDPQSADGSGTGLIRPSVITCLVMFTVYQDQIDQVLGKLNDTLLSQLDVCLKSTLNLH